MSRLLIVLLITLLGTSFIYKDTDKSKPEKVKGQTKLIKVSGGGQTSEIIYVEIREGDIPEVIEKCEGTGITLVAADYNENENALYEWKNDKGEILSHTHRLGLPSVDTTITYTLIKYVDNDIGNMVNNGGFENDNIFVEERLVAERELLSWGDNNPKLWDRKERIDTKIVVENVRDDWEDSNQGKWDYKSRGIKKIIKDGEDWYWRIAHAGEYDGVDWYWDKNLRKYVYDYYIIEYTYYQYIYNFYKKFYTYNSDYTYVRNTGSKALWDAKTYTIGTNPASYHSDFANMSAHEGNRMLIANGGPNITDRVWYQEIDIKANTKYAFSFWGASVTSDSPAKLSFFVSNGPLSEDQITNGEGRIGNVAEFDGGSDWEKYFSIWDSGDFAGRKYISLVNSNNEGSGNDFAVDDIEFRGTNTITNYQDVRIEVEPRIEGNAEENITLCEGEELNMEMLITGSANSYVWTKDENPISGTENKYKITNPKYSDSGIYKCEATSNCGGASKTYTVTIEKNIQTGTIRNKNN